MESDAELNELLLNAMFALNEAGDDLDEIYRIGLETAVSLLNADRGCIFKRDDWDDNKWTVANTHQFDSKQAEQIAVSLLLSPAADNATIGNSSEILDWYKNQELANPNAITFFPLKMFKWSRWIMQIESDNQSQFNEKAVHIVTKLIHQVGLFLQKICLFEDTKFYLSTFIHETRAPISIIIGYLNLLLYDAAGPLTAKQCQFVHSAHKTATLINNLQHSPFHFPSFVNSQNAINAQLFREKIAAFSPHIQFNFSGSDFTLYANELVLFHIIKAITIKSIQTQVTLNKKAYPHNLSITCFYSDSTLTDKKSTNLQIWDYNSIILENDGPLSIMKTFINYLGGQFKISAEARKGYTLTITFPIVTEDANE